MAERPSRETIEAGHELSGANARGIFWFILCFLLAMGVIHLVLWGTLGRMNRHEVKREAGASPIGEARVRELDQPLQPAPGHPTAPAQDLAAMKAEQLSRLHSYGPVEGDAGHVHIPIERAMEMLLQSGELKRSVKGAETQPFINQTQPAPTENRT
jgi:hypothetical protein